MSSSESHFIWISFVQADASLWKVFTPCGLGLGFGLLDLLVSCSQSFVSKLKINVGTVLGSAAEFSIKLAGFLDLARTYSA